MAENINAAKLDELLTDVAKLVAGLQVPVSLGLPLGAAREPWQRLFDVGHGFGWVDADDVKRHLLSHLKEGG